MTVQRALSPAALVAALVAAGAIAGCGGSTVSVEPGSGVAVDVQPRTAQVAPLGSVTFSATVTGTANTAVTWSVVEGPAGGSVSQAGLYVAPAATGTYHVEARSQADPLRSAAASVVVTTSSSSLPWLHVEGNQIKDPHGNRVVLRGVAFIDTQMYDFRGGIATMIDRVTTPGAGGPWETRVLRLAIYPDNHTDPGSSSPYQPPRPWPFDPAPGGGNDSYFADIVKPAVDYATSKGLYVIIDYHDINSAGTVYSGQTMSRAQMCAAFWQWMAPKFANQSNVIYEVFNEPIDDNFQGPASRWAAFKPTMQAWVDTIRAAAPNNLVLVGNPLYNQTPGAAADSPIAGPNLVYTAHPYSFNYTSFQSEIVRASTKVPVILTEWGDPSNTGYLNAMRSMADANGISNTAWCADYAWWPNMFNANWTPNAFGNFVKQWLYDMRNSDQPVP